METVACEMNIHVEGTNFKQPRVKRSKRKSRRALWQEQMVQAYSHITWCEWRNCKSTFGLSHAHSMVKTKITTREQWMEIAKLCTAHHNFVDHGDRKHKGTHRRQARLIRTLIAGR